MDSMNILSETLKLDDDCDENAQNVDFDENDWNCVTSEKFLACFFEYFKEQEENEAETIRSKPMEDKKLVCSSEEYQQSLPILIDNTWYEQLCKCHNCIRMYWKQNVLSLFGIVNIIECLPTEILLMIFKHLAPSDRRVASECCKRFLEIWLCDDFNDDRRLVFDKCVLDPEEEPLSVLLKSSRIYRTLVFGDIEMRGESIFSGIFAENITTVELMNNFKNELSLLSRFPNLKTIKVAFIEQLGDFSNVPTSIELLVSSCRRYYSNNQLNMLKRYLDRTSDSFRVELNDCNSTEDIPKITESERKKFQSFHLNLQIYDSTFKLPRFESLKYLELNFDKCDYGTEKILDNLEEQCPALKDLSINIWKRFPHKNWTCFKTLKAWYVPKEEMSRLSIFTNLKKLSLTNDEVCFFGHDVVLNNNLKTLDAITYSANRCFTCFQTMTKSFPNLESLTCDFEVTNDHLEEFAANTPKLKSLQLGRVYASVSFVSLPNLTELCIPNYNVFRHIEALPFMLRLRRLDFSLSCLNFETVKIFERMPAVEDLLMFCDRIEGDQIALFDAVTKPLKRLTKIRFYCEQIQHEIYPGIIDAMANNCKYLQRLSFSVVRQHEESIPREKILKLLQKHSSLRCIDSVW